MNESRILLMDIGNTRIKWCYAGQGELSFEQSLRRDDAGFDHQLLCLDAKNVRQIWVSCVAQSAVNASIREWARMHRLSEPHFVQSPAVAFGLKNAYPSPERLGVDRWLAMLGARQLVTTPVCVIDAGTALTLDVVDEQGQHLGGLIVPGLQMMQRSLMNNTGQILMDQPGKLADLGANTTEAVQSGTHQALAALIDSKVMSLQARWPDLTTFITGGDVGTLLPMLQVTAHHQPDLIFRGLQVYAEPSG